MELRGSWMSPTLAARRCDNCVFSFSPFETPCRLSARSKSKSRESSFWASKMRCSCRTTSVRSLESSAAGPPASSASMRSCACPLFVPVAAAPPAAFSSVLRPLRPASKRSRLPFTPVTKGATTAASVSSACSARMLPWRQKICQRPVSPCIMPTKSCRNVVSRTVSMVRAASIHATMVLSETAGPSLNTAT